MIGAAHCGSWGMPMRRKFNTRGEWTASNRKIIQIRTSHHKRKTDVDGWMFVWAHNQRATWNLDSHCDPALAKVANLLWRQIWLVQINSYHPSRVGGIRSPHCPLVIVHTNRECIRAYQLPSIRRRLEHRTTTMGEHCFVVDPTTLATKIKPIRQDSRPYRLFRTCWQSIENAEAIKSSQKLTETDETANDKMSSVN